MDKELKRKWVEALRSGKYEQGHGALRKDDKFCCLGVLCDVVDPNGWSEDCYWRGEYALPPSHVLGNLTASDLVYLNDEKNLSFEQIADYIEKHIEAGDE